MCFIFSLFPATTLTVLGYFVLFSSTKVEGKVHTFGKVLAVWVFVVAASVLLMGLTVTISGLCPVGEFMQQMHSSDMP